MSSLFNDGRLRTFESDRFRFGKSWRGFAKFVETRLAARRGFPNAERGFLNRALVALPLPMSALFS